MVAGARVVDLSDSRRKEDIAARAAAVVENQAGPVVALVWA
jgi:hypothetical protein